MRTSNPAAGTKRILTSLILNRVQIQLDATKRSELVLTASIQIAGKTLSPAAGLLVLIPNDETPYQYRKLTPFQLLTNQRFLQQQTTPQFREVIDAIGAKNLNATAGA